MRILSVIKDYVDNENDFIEVDKFDSFVIDYLITYDERDIFDRISFLTCMIEFARNKEWHKSEYCIRKAWNELIDRG